MDDLLDEGLDIELPRLIPAIDTILFMKDN